MKIVPLVVVLSFICSLPGHGVYGQEPAPVLSPGGGLLERELRVRIDSCDPQATIRYTTNGLDPNVADRVIASGSNVFIPRNLILKAKAWNGAATSPVTTGTFFPASAIAAGGYHGLALRFNSKVIAWGYNSSGQLANGTTATPQCTPAFMLTGSTGPILTGAEMVAGGLNHTLVLKASGSLYSTGDNSNGQLGVGGTTDRHWLVPVVNPDGSAFTDVIEIASGENHSLAIKSGGGLWAWGRNSYGSVGIGNTSSPQQYPVRVKLTGTSDLPPVTGVAGGNNHSLAISASDGSVWAWGRNNYSQLGDNTASNQPYPVKVVTSSGTLSGIVQVDCGGEYSLACGWDGSVWAWGYNGHGSVGNGTSTTQKTASKVFQIVNSGTVYLSNIVSVAAGDCHALALKNDGTVLAWGYNSNGQLGDGTLNDRFNPVSVLSGSGTLNNIVAIAAGYNFSMAMDSDGRVYTWGAYNNGQLGNGSASNPGSSCYATPYPSLPQVSKAYPSVSLISDLPSYVAPANIMLTASASDPDGWLAGIEIRNGATLLQSSTVANFSMAWTGVPSGNYFLSAKAADVDGAETVSSPVNISVLPPTVSVEPPTNSIAEPDKYPGTEDSQSTGGFRLWRTFSGTPPPNVPLSITYSVAGSAMGGSDYVSLSGSAIIPAGAGYVDVPVRPLADMKVEGPESVTLSVAQQSSYLVSTASTATLTITDTPPTVSVSKVADTSYDAQGAAVSGTIRFSRSGPLGPLSVRYSVSSQALPGVDYVALSGTVDFGANVASVDVPVTPIISMNSSKPLAIIISPDATYSAPSESSRATMILNMPTGKVVGGGAHALAMRANGELYAWGAQDNGRLGNGQTDNANITKPNLIDKTDYPYDFVGAVAIGAGAKHSLAIYKSGDVYAFGYNSDGQLGDNTTSQRAEAVHVLTGTAAGSRLTGARAVAGGNGFSLALSGTGEKEVWSWGTNSSGRTGRATTSGDSLIAGYVLNSGSTHLNRIESISAGEDFGLAVADNGTVWSWGDNSYGQLGDSTTSTRSFAVNVLSSSGTSLTDVVAVSAGRRHSVALRQSAKENGTVWCWGNQSSGSLGNGATSGNLCSPTVVLTGSGTVMSGTLCNVVQIAAGPDHTLALDKFGTVWAWGDNSKYQLGNNSTSDSYYATPVALPGNPKIVSIGAGGYFNGTTTLSFSFAVASNGQVYSWGYNADGELGIADNTDPQKTPQPAAGDLRVSHQFPRVTLQVDLSKAPHVIPSSALVTGSAIDLDGSISRIDLYCDSILLKSWTAVSEYSYSWKPQVPGSYRLRVVATDNNGNRTSVEQVINANPLCVCAYPVVTGTHSVYHLSALASGGGALGAEESYSWTCSDPAAKISFTSPSEAVSEVVVDSPGIYQLCLTVTYSSGLSDSKLFTLNASSGTLLSASDWYRRGNQADPYGLNGSISPYLIALDCQNGIELSARGKMPGIFSSCPWFLRIPNTSAYLLSPNSSNVLGYQTVDCFENPVVAFGSACGGSPLYINQSYRFGVGGGAGLAPSTLPDIRISVYDRAAFTSGTGPVVSGTVVTFNLPRPNGGDWSSFQSKGYVWDLHTENIGLSTRVQYVPATDSVASCLVVTHMGLRTDKYYKVEFAGVAVRNGNFYPMASTSVQAPAIVPVTTAAYSNGYTLDFDERQSWWSTYIDQPHFFGTALPPEYQGKSVDELLRMQQGTSNPVLANFSAPSTSGSFVLLGASPELRRHPLLDKFAVDMAYDPIAIANYVLNEIELTDAIAYKNVDYAPASSINPGGVNRGALATFLEAQGNPAEQCALLIYLLRQCKDPATGKTIPCGYVFPNQDETKVLDAQMSRILRMQLAGVGEGSPKLLSVNYPWVAAYIGGEWVHIFPWLKDTVVEEKLDFYSYMPDGCRSATQWVRGYLLNDPAMRLSNSLDPEIKRLAAEYDNPGVLFPLYVKNALKTYHPEISYDDLGVLAYNRRNYFNAWSEFPKPWSTGTLNDGNLFDSLSRVTGIFDTIQVLVSNQAGQTIIDAGAFNAMDLHNHRLLVYPIHSATNATTSPANVTYLNGTSAVTTQLRLSVESFAPGSPKLLASPLLSSTDQDFNLNIVHHRNKIFSMAWSGQTDLRDVRPFKRDDMVALCYDFGRVTAGMVDVQAKQYWAAQQNQTSGKEVDIEVNQGIPAYLAGMSYYQKISDFKETLGALTKFHSTSFVANGLSVISARGLKTFDNYLLPSSTPSLLHPGDLMELNIGALGCYVKYTGSDSVDLDGISSIRLYPDPNSNEKVLWEPALSSPDNLGIGMQRPCELFAGVMPDWHMMQIPEPTSMASGMILVFNNTNGRCGVTYLGATRAVCIAPVVSKDGHECNFSVDGHPVWKITAHENPYAASDSIRFYLCDAPVNYIEESCKYPTGNSFSRDSEGWYVMPSLSTFIAEGASVGLNLPIFSKIISQATVESDVRVLPRVDMHFQELSIAGNQTLHPGSGEDANSSFWNWAPIFNAEVSAQEHRVINRFYQKKDAISTVKLLDLAQAKAAKEGGLGFVSLNAASDLQVEGNKSYALSGTSKPLQQWDSSMWTRIQSALTTNWDRSYTTVIMTPGPVSSVPDQGASAYAGVGAFIVGVDSVSALISGNLNGGSCGSYLPDISFEPSLSSFTSTTLSLSLGDISITLPGVGINSNLFSSSSCDLLNFSNQYDTLKIGDLRLSTASIAALNQSLSLTGYSSPLITNLNTTADFMAAADASKIALNVGFLGVPTDYRSMFGSLGKGVVDPVNSVTGEFYVDSVDLKLNGPMPLEIRRNYGSQNLADNSFGFGWKMSYFPYLVLSSATSEKQLIYAAEMDGSVIAYRQQASPSTRWIPMPEDNPSLANLANDTAGSLGNVFNNQIDVNGSTYTLTGADGSVRTFQVRSFPTPGDDGLTRSRPYLTQWTDSRGNYFKFFFGQDSSTVEWGQLVRIESSNGNFVGFNYNANGHIVQAFSGDGRRLKYDYDDDGDLVKVSLPDGSSIGYDYKHSQQTSGEVTDWASDHLIVRERKPDGRILENDYDDQRRVTEQRSTIGSDKLVHRSASFEYHSSKDPSDSTLAGYTVITDANRKPTRYDFSKGQITTITDPLNQIVKETWYQTDDPAIGAYRRSLATRTDKRGLRTSFLYDSRGNLVQRSETGNLTGSGTSTATWNYSYNERNLVISGTDPMGIVTVNTYGTLPGQYYLPVTVTKQTASGQVISSGSMEYENVSDGKSSAFAVLHRTTQAVGTLDQVVTTLTNDAHGFPSTKSVGPNASNPTATVQYHYNLRGELTSETSPDATTTSYAYDGLGNRMWQEVRDNAGKLLDWQYDYYNQNSELEWSQGSRYNPADYVYRRHDGAGRLSEEIKWRSEASPDGTGVQAVQGEDAYASTFYGYDLLGNLTEIRDPRHNSITMQYDEVGRVTGRQVHDGDANCPVIASESFPEHEPGGEATTSVSALGGATYKKFTSRGNLYWQKNPDGTVQSWRYDLKGRLREETLTNSAVRKTEYDDGSRTVTVTLLASGSAISQVTRYDRRGNVVEQTDGESNTVSMTYDPLNRVLTRTAIDSTGASPTQTETHVYNDAARLHTVTNSLMESTVTTSDALGRPVSIVVKDSQGAAIRVSGFAYSDDHQSVTQTSGSNASVRISTTTFTDTFGKPVLVKTGSLWSSTRYDAGGNVVAVRNEQGLFSSSSYDSLGRVQTQRTPSASGVDGAQTTFVYLDGGKKTERHMPGGAVAYESIDSAGRKTSEELGASGTSARTRLFDFTYYPADASGAGVCPGKLWKVTDPRGVVSTTAYDGFGRVRTLSSEGGIPELNQSTGYSYDRRSLVTQICQQYADAATGPSTQIDVAYDGLGQKKSETVRLDGEVFNQWTQGWNAAGRRDTLASSLSPVETGAGSYSFVHRADGLLKTVTASGQDYAFGFEDNGLLASRTNTWRTFSVDSRDSLGRINSFGSTVSGVPALSGSVSWRNDSRIDTYTETRSGFSESRRYDYNDRGQLLREPFLGVSGPDAFVYQFDGNQRGVGPGVRTLAETQNTPVSSGSSAANLFMRVTTDRQSVAGASSDSSSWNYDNLGALVTGSSAAGLAQTFTWDALGRLVAVSKRDPAGNGLDWRAIYDGLGRRLRVIQQPVGTPVGSAAFTSGTIDSYYDPQVEFLELGVALNGSRTWKVYGPDLSGNYGGHQGIGGLEATLDEGTGTVTAALNDFFGNTVATIAGGQCGGDASNGATLTWTPGKIGAYGMLPCSQAPVYDANNSNLARCTAWRGKRIDATGLYYLGARYYDPQSGRFISPDPLGHGSSPSLYDYANGDPVNGMDPDGRCNENYSSLDKLSNSPVQYTESNAEYQSHFVDYSNYKEAPLARFDASDLVTSIASSIPFVKNGYEFITGKSFETPGLQVSRAQAAWGLHVDAALLVVSLPMASAGAEIEQVGANFGRRVAAERLAGGPGGSWKVISEVADGATRQLTQNACGPAIGQMLLADRGIAVFQSNIAAQMGSVLSSPEGMELSMKAFQNGWQGGYVGHGAFGLLNRGGSWGAMMRGSGSIDHWIVIDGLDDAGRVMVRDPYQGSSYLMQRSDFLDRWNGNALWGPRP